MRERNGPGREDEAKEQQYQRMQVAFLEAIEHPPILTQETRDERYERVREATFCFAAPRVLWEASPGPNQRNVDTYGAHRRHRKSDHLPDPSTP